MCGVKGGTDTIWLIIYLFKLMSFSSDFFFGFIVAILVPLFLRSGRRWCSKWTCLERSLTLKLYICPVKRFSAQLQFFFFVWSATVSQSWIGASPLTGERLRCLPAKNPAAEHLFLYRAAMGPQETLAASFVWIWKIQKYKPQECWSILEYSEYSLDDAKVQTKCQPVLQQLNK